MSVLIDGIPMPKDCRDCCFKYESDASDRLAYCYISGCWTIPKDSERAEVCLLKETQPEPHWIPVTERLPEPRTDVWVNSDIGQIQGYYEESVEIWYASFGQGRDYLELIVNAWMPLPEPYREEGD